MRRKSKEKTIAKWFIVIFCTVAFLVAAIMEPVAGFPLMCLAILLLIMALFILMGDVSVKDTINWWNHLDSLEEEEDSTTDCSLEDVFRYLHKTGIPLGEIPFLLQESVTIDGASHKQWYLEQIALILDVKLPDHEEGIAP